MAFKAARLSESIMECHDEAILRKLDSEDTRMDADDNDKQAALALDDIKYIKLKCGFVYP